MSVRIDRVHRVGLALPLAALLLAGCAAPAQLGRTDRQRLVGRTYVIVGASSGFGRGAALALGRAHANVVLAARRTDLLDEVAAEIDRSGGRALAVPTDVAVPEQVEALARAAEQRFGPIDVWMNIAGVGAVGRFWEVPAADQARIVDVNLKGIIYGSHAALTRFVAQRHGTLVNMGSVESAIPLAYHSTYAATKAGVLSLGHSINQELRQAGLAGTVKVATVMPWAVDTPFFRHVANYSGHADRMILLDAPDQVVRGLVWVSLHPRQDFPVGVKAQGAELAHRVLPRLTEHMAADIHRDAIAKGTPTPPTSGSVQAPMAAGRGVEGGVRASMKAEDAARRAGTPPPSADPGPPAG